MTRHERLILSNQFAILEKVDPNQAEFYHQAQEILQYGYEAEYSRLWDYISPDEFTRHQSEEVNNILEMFRSLADAYGTLEDKAGIEPHNISFLGFDGNNESDQMAYARFLRDELHAWESVLTRDLNSHHPTLDRYRQMLTRYTQSADRFHLTRGDIIRIIAR
jgi:uncharacterized protein YfbU (UPF0304 family)